MFVEERGALPFKFAAPLRTGVPAMFGVPQNVYDDLIENHKEEPTELLGGMSPREAQIWLSEEVMKPKFGDDIFGKIAANRIENASIGDNDLWVCSDSGFVEEAEVLVDKFGRLNVLILQIKRENTSFDGDSRSYIKIPGVGLAKCRNNGTKEELFRIASALLDINFI